MGRSLWWGRSKKSNKDGDRFNLRINGVEYQRDFSYPDAKSYIEANADVNPEKNRSKFSQYQLEGEKENYKEVLVTLPQSKQQKEINRLAEKYGVSNTYTALRESNATDSELEFVRSLKNDQFKSSHFDEPNILVHLRMNTRTDAQGNKVLFLEEVQSDWGQKGKKEGFRQDDLKLTAKKASGDNRFDVYQGDRLIRAAVFAQNAERAIAYIENNPNEYGTNSLKTPAAPFVTDTNAWTKLGFKVALKEAVKQGADKIAWTTGEQQNDRYDLSKQVDEIGWQKNENGTYNITPKKDGSVVGTREMMANLTLKQVEDYVGKDVAQKIENEEGKEWDGGKVKQGKLKGQQLKVGGKGMKGFYGSPTEGSLGIVGNVAKSLFKQEPKTVDIFQSDKLASGWSVTVKDKQGNVTTNMFDSKSKGLAWLSKQDGVEVLSEDAEGKNYSTQHSIDITPEMRKQVETEGQPLFKDAEAQYRVESGKNIIEAIKDFDGSPRATVALTHEIMHPTVVAIIDGAKEGNEVGAKHTQTIVDEFNKANPKNQVTVEDLINGNDAFKEGTTSKQYRAVQEFIAKSWEKYHREGGKGFSEQFQKVLEQITQAFQSVYKSLTGKQLTPELRKMFDEILSNSVESNLVDNKMLLPQKESDNIKAVYDHANNIITILKKGDISSIMHELGHSYRFLLKQHADNGNKIAKKYMDAFDNFAMGEEGKKFFQKEKIDGIHSLDNFKFINEFFARSFESYLFDGGKGGKGYKIEDINVKRLLGKFKDWLKEIYGNVKKGAINIKLTDEVRDVFESIVGNKNKLFDLETYIETKFGRFPKREDIKESDVVDMINQMKNNVLDPDTRNASMKLLHDIFSKFKRQYIGQRYKGNSRLINPDLVKLMKTPKFSTPEGFEKHLALFKAIIDNSRFKFAWQQMSRFRDAAKKSVYSKRSSNIEFYSLLMRLASVNPEFITVETTTHTDVSGKNINVKAKIGELESYNRLLQTRPTDMGIADFTKRVEYYESKAREYRVETERERLQNAAEAEFNAEVGDDNSVYIPTEYEQMLLRKGREDATSKARDYAIQKGKIDITKVSESEFFGLDIADMTDAELKRYSEIIAMVSRSPEGYTVTPEMVELTNKVQARLTGESLAEEISDYWRRKLASFNYNFMRKDGSLKRSIANRLFNPYGFGALSNYNLKDALNFLDGIREDYGGAVVQAIFMPLENNNNKMRSTLNNVFTSINQFKSNKDSNLNLTEGQFHKIGIHWLLSQKPDIKISVEDFEYIFNDETGVAENVFEEAGISVDNAREILMPGDVLKVEDFYKKNKNGIYEEREDLDANKTALLEIYKKLMELRNNHIKNSIIISFGEKPEGMPQAEYEKHLKIMTNSSDLMMEIAGHEVKHLGTGNWFDAARSHVKDKRMQLLDATGNQNASASVADMLSRPIELSERELEFYGIGVSLFDRLQNGDFTNGLTMKEISDSYTKNTTSPFEAVRNYAPMLRFNESRYEGSEAYEDEAGRVRPEPIFKTRTNLSSSTQFLKARKKSVTALNTNAFQMIEKRFDQELFYMTNEPHRVFLEELYKQPQFKRTDYNKKEDDGTIDNITLDYVRNNLSVYFHRGITAGKMAIKNDEVTSKIMNIVDDFKIVALSPIRTSFAQATSGFISQANLKGTALERFNDIWAGYNDVLLGGDRVHDMIQSYAPEVAYRGLSDYDLGTERVSPTISGLFDRYYRGEFKHENGYFGELINSMKDRRAANQKALLPMIYFDRLAARATFMGAYRNFCKNHGIELNYDLPDKDAVDFAVSVVRKSQATDNELFKPGVLNGIRAQEGYNPYNTDVTENSAYAELLRKGYWNFKSFTLAEKNNIAIKMIKTFRGPDKIWQNIQEKEDAIQALAYSFAGNMLFNYSKSFFKSAFYGVSMYAGYMMNINGGAPTMNDEENFLVDLIKGEYGDLKTKNTESLTEAKKSYKEVKEEEITSKKEEYGDNNGFTNTGFYYNVVKSFIQQFGINELGQAGVSMLMRYFHDKSLNYNESIGVRMDKLYKQSEDLNMLGIASDVFSPEVLIGGEINSQSYVNDIMELARAITSKEYNTTPDMWMSATQFGASAAGLGVFSRLPMSYPSLHKWLQDNEMHRKKLSGYSNVSKDNVKPEVTGVINEQEEKDKISPINTDDNTEE